MKNSFSVLSAFPLWLKLFSSPVSFWPSLGIRIFNHRVHRAHRGGKGKRDMSFCLIGFGKEGRCG
jgi:hypothetical protein